MRRVAIVGSRDFVPGTAVKDFVAKLSGTDVEIVSGGARGVDLIAENSARLFNLPVKVFKADWKAHGKRAGVVRNKEIVDYADEIVAFWDGTSRGTKYTIDFAKEAGKPVMIIMQME